MHKVYRDNFDPTAEYVVFKPLLFGGRRFVKGDLFDVKTTERQMRNLYDGRFLDFKPIDFEPEPQTHEEQHIISRYLEPLMPGWFNVLDRDRHQINDKKMRIKNAIDLIMCGG